MKKNRKKEKLGGKRGRREKVSKREVGERRGIKEREEKGN